MSVTYQIRDWDRHFENSDSRKVRALSWVPMRNKHDGAGYRRVAILENSADVFCGWCLIVQVASRMPTRGVLCDIDGPLDAADLAARTGYPERVFTAAFEALTSPKIQWLERVNAPGSLPETPISSTSVLPASTSVLPFEVPLPGKKGVEGKGTEVVASATTSLSPTVAENRTASTYPTMDEAKAYAESQTQRTIKPEWVEKWWLDRDRKGWTYDTRSGSQVPIRDWKSDIQFYAKAWKDTEDKKAAKDREKEAKAIAKKNPPMAESESEPITVAELPPVEAENPFPAMFAQTAERRRKHEEWLATPHDPDEPSPYL